MRDEWSLKNKSEIHFKNVLIFLSGCPYTWMFIDGHRFATCFFRAGLQVSGKHIYT